MSNKIVYQVHHMWYETDMIKECYDSLVNALKLVPKDLVDIKICFNFQTYIEEPTVENYEEMLNVHLKHPLFELYTPELISKTNEDDFYNIADWRREIYDPEAKYTVWGETDTILPRDFFAILNMVNIEQKHVLTFSGRPMWDNSWDIVTHDRLQGYFKPCVCEDKNCRTDCIELLEAPLKYKDYIKQDELDKFNDESGDIRIEQVPWKIDGSTVCISGGLDTPFIAPGMHFVREDTCLEYYLRIKNIPQVCIKSRLKGHNYKHPNKRVGTNATRNDDVFKRYADQSITSMNKFLNQL